MSSDLQYYNKKKYLSGPYGLGYLVAYFKNLFHTKTYIDDNIYTKGETYNNTEVFSKNQTYDRATINALVDAVENPGGSSVRFTESGSLTADVPYNVTFNNLGTTNYYIGLDARDAQGYQLLGTRIMNKTATGFTIISEFNGNFTAFITI